MIHNYNTLEAFHAAQKRTNAAENDLAVIDDTKQVYEYHNGEWKEFSDPENKGLEVSLYDLNSQIISQLTPYQGDDKINATELLNMFAKSCNNIYYVLTCFKIGYITIFQEEFKSAADFYDVGTGVLECAQDLGAIHFVSVEDDHAEIWVKDKETEEMHCLIFFPYDSGIVKFGGVA